MLDLFETDENFILLCFTLPGTIFYILQQTQNCYKRGFNSDDINYLCLF